VWAALPMDDYQLLNLYRWLCKHKELRRATIDVGGGHWATVAGCALRDLRLVVHGAAEEAKARIADDLRWTADLDSCIKHLESVSRAQTASKTEA